MRDEPTCEAALWGACAVDCADDFGSCMPRAGGSSGAYRCQSKANRLDHDVLASGCSDALGAGVALGSESYEACNGYGGFCDRVGDDALRCMCTDGNTHDEVYDRSGRHAPCRRALERACGTGEPPEGAFCTATGNDYAARCLRAPATTAPHRCECVLQGAAGDVLVEDVLLSGLSCGGALLTVCPETEPFADDARATVCDHYDACDERFVGFDRAQCVEGSADACVACSITALADRPLGADGCPEQRLDCYAACEDLVPRETAIAACEQSLGERDALTDSARCLCDRCYPAFGQCMADDGCVQMLDCAAARGCQGTSCTEDPVCGPLIELFHGTRSLALALQVSGCEARDECAALDP
jgi:hypothetical protein